MSNILPDDSAGFDNTTGFDNSTDFPDSALLRFKTIYLPFHGYLSLVVCIFGIVTNIANIIVLTRKEMISPTNAILTGLAVADMLVMLDYVPYTIHNYIHSGQSLEEMFSYGWSVYALVHAHFSVVCHAISIWLTLLLAIWRYIAVKYPTESKLWCSMRKTVISIVVTHLAVILSCIPVYLSYTIHQMKVPQGGIYYRVDWSSIALESDAFLKKLNFWVFSVATKLGPCILLTYLSITLILALIEANKRRQRLKNKPHMPNASKGTSGNSSNLMKNATTMSSATITVTNASGTTSSTVTSTITKQPSPSPNNNATSSSSSSNANDRTNRMLVLVLLLFLLAEFPSGILTLLIGILDENYYNNYYDPLAEILDIVALVNSSINFVLYCSMSSIFRETFLQLFCATCSRASSSTLSSSSNNNNASHINHRSSFNKTSLTTPTNNSQQQQQHNQHQDHHKVSSRDHNNDNLSQTHVNLSKADETLADSSDIQMISIRSTSQQFNTANSDAVESERKASVNDVTHL